MNTPGYERLAAVLRAAYDQAAQGKGKERHANDLPFHEQPMQQIARRRGLGFILGQADKKSEEAQGLLERGDFEAFRREILGAINYLAGAIIFAEPGRPDWREAPQDATHWHERAGWLRVRPDDVIEYRDGWAWRVVDNGAELFRGEWIARPAPSQESEQAERDGHVWTPCGLAAPMPGLKVSYRLSENAELRGPIEPGQTPPGATHWRYIR